MSNVLNAAVVHHQDFSGYDFGPQHPLRPERIPLGLDLLRQTGIWHPESETLIPTPATREELELVHAPEYIQVVEEASHNSVPAHLLEQHGLTPGDNPAFPGMHEASALVVGGTLQAAREILGNHLHHAFNPAGGWHHAQQARASGFCIYNDAAVAAAAVTREYGARVLYVDFDCHHGDGMQWLFYGNQDVLTVSFHETGRFLFPGTGSESEIGEGNGKGFAVNIPVAPFTQDASWLESVHDILPDVARRFEPDLIISNHGADTHAWDPLTHLALTTNAFFDQAQLVHELAHELTGGRWLAVGSGGYEWRAVVPRSWAIVWAEMSGRTLPAAVPGAWRDRWASIATEPLPLNFRDAANASPLTDRQIEIEHLNRDTVGRARDLLGLGPAT